MPNPVAVQTAKVCRDPVFLCWLEERPGLAAWMQFAGAMAAILATTAPFIIQMLKDGRAQRALKANALVAATNAVQAIAGTSQYLLSPDGVRDIRTSAPQIYLVENGLAELDKAPIYSVHDPDFIAQYQLVRMTAVALLAGIPDVIAAR